MSLCLTARPRPNARCQGVEGRLWQRKRYCARRSPRASLAFAISRLRSSCRRIPPLLGGESATIWPIALAFWLPFVGRHSWRVCGRFRADFTRVARGFGDAYDIEELLCNTLWRDRSSERPTKNNGVRNELDYPQGQNQTVIFFKALLTARLRNETIWTSALAIRSRPIVRLSYGYSFVHPVKLYRRLRYRIPATESHLAVCRSR